VASNVRRVSAVAALVIGWLGCAAPTWAQESAGLVLTVVIRGQELVASDVLQQSMTVVSRIYRQVGVEIAWLQPDGFAAAMPSDTEDRIRFCRRIVLVTLHETVPPGFLPGRMEVLGVAGSGTRLAHVFLDRATTVADRGRVHLGDLLGHVIAHEMGHLLLPPNAHTLRGLMRASLDLELVDRQRLEFDRGQAAMIRAKVAAEMRTADVH